MRLSLLLAALSLTACFSSVDDVPDETTSDTASSETDAPIPDTDVETDAPPACETECLGADPACCGGTCVDLEASGAHCGACGQACAEGLLCIEGACVCNELRVLDIQPPPNGVTTDGFATLTFNCPVDEATLTEGISIFGQWQGRQNGEGAYLDDPTTLQVAATLRAGETIEFTLLAGGITSTTGESLVQPLQWRYRDAIDQTFTSPDYTPRSIPDALDHRSHALAGNPISSSIIFANEAENIPYTYDSNGDFRRTVLQSFGTEDDVAVAFADIDGDSDLDLFFGARYIPEDTRLKSLWFERDNQILDLDQPSAYEVDGADVAWGDVDRDGVLDLVLARDDPASRTQILTWDGEALRAEQTLGDSNDGQRNTSAALGDVDGDGVLDLALSARDEKAYIAYGSSSGFGALRAVGDTGGLAVALGDLNGDRLDDLVHGTQSLGVVIWLSQNGLLSVPTTLVDSAEVRDIALGDLDGDDDLDVVIASSVADAYYLNEGDGRLFSEVKLGSQSHAVLLMDVNDDGLLDLIFADADAGEPNVAWLSNP